MQPGAATGVICKRRQKVQSSWLKVQRRAPKEAYASLKGRRQEPCTGIAAKGAAADGVKRKVSLQKGRGLAPVEGRPEGRR
eukprot:356695-Chlamydomonas_euryale.AAC.6